MEERDGRGNAKQGSDCDGSMHECNLDVGHSIDSLIYVSKDVKLHAKIANFKHVPHENLWIPSLGTQMLSKMLSKARVSLSRPDHFRLQCSTDIYQDTAGFD